jgi:hypothetical protein
MIRVEGMKLSTSISKHFGEILGKSYFIPWKV